MQEAKYPQRKGVKEESGNHSFVSYGKAVSVSISDGELFYWNIFSTIAKQDTFLLHKAISKHEKHTTVL